MGHHLESFPYEEVMYMPQGVEVGPSGEGLGLGGLLPSRFKVQHLLGANNSLGSHLLMKSQRFIQFCVEKFLRVQCTGSRFTLQGWIRRALPCRGSVISKKKKVYAPKCGGT
jgi:hypothetical protein